MFAATAVAVVALVAAVAVAASTILSGSGHVPGLGGGAVINAGSSPVASSGPSPAATPVASPASTPTGELYVSPTGSDSSPGTLGAPWKTLQHAADVAPPGATVIIRAGTYAPFVMRRSGSAAAPTKLIAFPGEKPVIDGRQQIDYTVRFVGAAYVTLSGVTVTGGTGPRQTGGGVSVDTSNHVTIQGSEIHHNRAFGVRIVGSSDVLVTANDIHDNAVGVRVSSSGNGNVISANRIHDNNLMMTNTLLTYGDDAGGDGVAIVSTTGEVTVEGNQLWRNRALSYDYGYDGGAFSVYAASNWTIRNNTTWDNRNVLETGTDPLNTPCDNGRFVRNLSYGQTSVDRSVGLVLRCASNTIVANNTFSGLQYFTFDISNNTRTFGGSIDGLRIVNNVVSVAGGKIYGLESALPASVVIDYNVLYNSGTGYFASRLGVGLRTLADFQAATGRDRHSVFADPRFIAAASGDYSLAAGSPAIDRGTTVAGVTTTFAGTRPDCGYLEAAAP